MRVTRTLLIGAALLLLGTSLSARAEVHEVSMSGFTFVPDMISIAPGDSVHWVNSTQTIHTVTSGEDCSADGLFDSGNLEPDDEFGYRFDEEGDYPYFCIPHCGSGMTGRIEVEEDTAVETETWGRIRSLYR
ncbi:MAG: amicyanin [Candidatus Eisenbacteria bacterium]|nr:amicyanin [Candidatus Latescibacterota bacterium]MBD3301992.1 amicyanin [Candidatus Eisenbacteria bacterium]